MPYIISPETLLLIHSLYLIGIVAEAMTGAISAGRKHMDIFGIITIATMTALGGGSIRDVLLGHYPLTWIAHPFYLLSTIMAALIALPIVNMMSRLHKLFLILDAIGLVTFAYIGAELAYSQTHSYIISITMGVITGVFGGMLRDILCNDIPLVFRSELYATIALFVSILAMFVLKSFHSTFYGTLIILILGFIARLVAIYKKIHLPFIKY